MERAALSPFHLVLSLYKFVTLVSAMQAPIGKPCKTLGLAHHRVEISSRIREVRENLCWILEGSALQLEGLEVILVIFIGLIFGSISETLVGDSITLPGVRLSGAPTEGRWVNLSAL